MIRKELVAASAEPLILSLLAKGESYGYAIIQEVKARKGPIIAITTEGNTDLANKVDDIIYVPETLDCLTPLLTVAPLQLLAYHIAVLRGCDVDKPRNLAKSVTVE